MANYKIKIICPLTYTKCDITCYKYFDNCKLKNKAILNEIVENTGVKNDRQRNFN